LNEALRPIFGSRVFRWDDQAIDQFGLSGVDHLVRTALEGPLDTGLLMGSLFRKTLAAGIFFRPGAEVTGFEDGPSQVLIRLKDGEMVNASRVAICTNGYVRQLLPQLAVTPARGQVLLTAPVPGLKLKGTFHYREGYYYFRDHAGAVLLGGGRDLDLAGETTMDEGTTPLIQRALEQLLREVIVPGQPFTIARRWSGIMGMGPSKSPIIEPVSQRVIAAVRLGGMGVAIGIRVAREAARMLA
jgi:hypothetical protein